MIEKLKVKFYQMLWRLVGSNVVISRLTKRIMILSEQMAHEIKENYILIKRFEAEKAKVKDLEDLLIKSKTKTNIEEHCLFEAESKVKKLEKEISDIKEFRGAWNYDMAFLAFNESKEKIKLLEGKVDSLTCQLRETEADLRYSKLVCQKNYDEAETYKMLFEKEQAKRRN